MLLIMRRQRLSAMLMCLLPLAIGAALASSLLAAPPPEWLKGTYEERLKAIRHSGPADAAALEDFLSAKAESVGVKADELNALKNEAGMTLMALPALPTDLARRFLTMAGDPTGDLTWRDYCVQFLGMGFARWAAEDKRAVATFLVGVAQKGKGATGGTALIALANNVQAPEVGADRVGALALAAVRDAAYGDGGRASAVQVCARLNVAAALSEARSLAVSLSTPGVLRGAAIAALGMLGDRSDEPALKELAKAGDPRIRVPAAAAIKRIEERLSNRKPGVRS